jgi:hypothetical protein
VTAKSKGWSTPSGVHLLYTDKPKPASADVSHLPQRLKPGLRLRGECTPKGVLHPKKLAQLSYA